MAEYADLSNIVGKMKRAAIDCWMADQSFYPNWGNDQIYAKWGWMLNFYNRPDENGNGGGDGNGVNHSVAAEFDAIRGAIDASVAPWLDLPDGSACSAPQSAAGATAAALGTSGAGMTVQNSHEIATSNHTIHETVVNRIRGSFKAPFLDKYYTQFSKVSYGLGDACVILEANYAAEGSMWPAARKDVATICENAQLAWAQQAGSAAAANGTFTLSVIAAVAGAVSSVVTAGAGAAVAVAALGTIAVAAGGAMEKINGRAEVSGNSFQSILDSLNGAFGTLNDALKGQEEELSKMMTEATTTMLGEIGAYNLDAFALGEYPTAVGNIDMTDEDANIVKSNMQRIESALDKASRTLGSAPDANPTPRDASIGLGASGTHTAASELYSVVAQCLSLTLSEYGNGRELFTATVEDFFETDAEVARTIAQILADEALTEEINV